MHPFSPGRRNKTPSPTLMADLVPLAKKQKSIWEDYKKEPHHVRAQMMVKKCLNFKK